ncbi:MAG: hypothetical protein Q7R81_07155 [Candidatus Peregrinibacteria bacterium]|nr:hypothetical protein [Candidatus Peregrinibacteria bacterium]
MLKPKDCGTCAGYNRDNAEAGLAVLLSHMTPERRESARRIEQALSAPSIARLQQRVEEFSEGLEPSRGEE